LDNLGDQDALLELMVFLSRHYPNATIEHFSSGDLPEGHTSGNLVVVGGPGSASDISNRLCREMMDAIRSRVSYSEDCEQMSVVLDSGKSLELHAEYGDRPRGNTAEQRRIREDIGYFARFPNPLNEESTVVLVNGIHTTGVLGAARVFSERREALPNFHTVLRTGASSTGFECYFNVRVLNGHARVPSVARDQVFPVSPAGAIVSAATTSDERAISVTSSRRSVTILFIAGDRGGSQLNQIQMPNEYHGIQDALLASKHRDAISLGGAILAATRERLAQAYRFRPQVIHFVGHGNERSLSIIEDHGAIANETPLDAVQLGAALGAIQERVMLCVLNACRSENLARQLVDACVVDCAIGWPARVSDSAAIAFSNALYGALGDGRTIADAVEVAKVACGSADPVLIAADGCHSNVLVAGEADDQ
jgi:hypothetical protein